MSNFTRSGRRAKIWQSIANLSCCSIDLLTKQSKSMKTFVLVMLLSFSTGSMFAQQDLARSTFISGCQEDAPNGFTVEEVQMLYSNNPECQGTTPEVTITVTMDGNDCDWTKEITYDVKCGAFEEQFKLEYFGGDEEAPSLNDDVEVPTGGTELNLCYSDIPAGPSIQDVEALYSDNCGTAVIVTKSGSPEGNDCDWTVTYKYTIQDQCGNFADDLDITYSGGDDEAPVLAKGAELPQAMTTGVNLCFEEKSQGPTEQDIAGLFVDNCGAVTVIKTSVSKGTDCKWMAEYTYTIQDDCGNFSEPLILTYYGGDSEAPTLTGVPADTTVNCIDEIPEPDNKNVSASDNCSSKLDIIVSDDDSQLGDSCDGGILVRTYSVTDDCGYSTSQNQVITVLPTPEATLEVPTFPTNISCEEANGFSAAAGTYDNGVAEGACAVSGTIEAELDVQYTECGGTITVSYDAVDSCDRPLSAGPFVITVDPAPMAEFDEVQGLSITCEDAALYEASPLAYSNGGSGVCEIAGEVEGELSGSYTECGGTLFVDWSYTDDCGRTITAQKEINVEPAPMAEFEAVEDMEISCEEANVFQASPLSYTNGGTGACEISGSVEGELSGSYTECGGTLEVDWSFTDACDRTITAKKTITVLPAPMASFDDVQDLEISCEEANNFSAGSLSYTNGGTGACEISGSVDGELSGDYDECGGTLYVNWTYTDNCERTIDAQQVITVLPAPMAEFEPVDDMEISCEEANNFAPSSLSYTNGGTGACEISGSVEGELSGSYDECGGTLEVDWSYTDKCDRTITAKKVITVLPAPAAEFDPISNITISCEEANSFQAGSLGYTNNGTGACEISGEAQGELTGSYDECGGLLFVDWSYTDDCGRTITSHQQVKVNPAPAAEFDQIDDLEISCEEANVFQAGSLSYTNNGTGACEISGSVQGELSGTYDECGGTLFVDFTFTDECERTITSQQEITVNPAPMASFDEIDDISISCEEANVFQAGSLSYTNNGTGACEISGSVEGELSGTYDECGGTLEVDWTFTDKCDRTINAKQVITVEPAPMASFDEIDDLTISCEEANVFQAGSLAYTNGGTGACEISGSVAGELSGSYTECGGTLLVDFTFTDACERTITAQQTITVEPAPMAAFEEVTDITISCEEANVFQAGSLMYSNGGTGLCEISGSVQGELSGTYDECGGTLEVDWTFTDNCQRTIDAKQVITVEPAPMASFDPVEDMTVSCEEAASVVSDATLVSGFVGDFESGNWSINTGGTDGTIAITATDMTITGAADGSNDVPVIATATCPTGGNYSFSWDFNTTDSAFWDPAFYVNGVAVIELTDPNGPDNQSGSISVNCAAGDVIGFSVTSQDGVAGPGVLTISDFVVGGTFLSYTNNGTGACEISGSVPAELSGSYDECGGELTLSWTYTDNCDRTITAQKVITVEPAPEAEFEPVVDMTVSCEEADAIVNQTLVEDFTNPGQINPFEGLAAANLTADPQDGNNQVLELVSQAAGNPWQGASLLNNIDLTNTKSVKIDVLADQAFDILVKVETTPDDFAETAGSYTNVGQWQTITVSFEQDQLVNGNIGDQAYGLLALFPGWDAAANTWAEPSDFTIYVDNVVVGGPGCLSYTNGGTGACEISGEVAGELSGEYDECGGLLEVDYTYTDDCGRTITAKKTITVEPAPMAAFDPVEDMTVSCEEAAAVVTNATIVEGFVGDFEAGNWSINTGGSDGSINITAADMTIVGGNDGGASTVIAEATCPTSGNYSFSWDFTTDDSSAFWDPAFYVNGVAVIQLTDDNLSAQSGSISVNCAAGDVIGFGVASQDGDFGAGTLTISDFVVGGTFLNYSNGGTGVCEIAGTVPAELSGEYDECGGALTLSWTYTDNCNRTITAQKVITVEPAPMAEFDEVEDITITCEQANLYEASPLAYSNGGTGLCEIAGEVDGELSGSYDECGGTLEVDWTYTDKCDRTITAKKIITVEPAPAAEFEEVTPIEITCEQANTYAAGSLAYSNGGTGACEISGSVPGELSGTYTECGGTLLVDWTFTDNCNRTITAQQVITVLPAPEATFESVNDLEISCEEANDFAAGTLSYSNGGTGLCEISGSVQGELSGEYDECGGTLYVDWTFTDNCNRTIDAQQIITVLPAPAAEFAPVEPMTISCEDANVFEPGTLSYTNGGTGACEISGEAQGELSGTYDECGGTLEVDWTFTDNCGRTIDAKKVITVEPAPMAAFDPVEDMTVSCEEAASVVTNATIVEGFVGDFAPGNWTIDTGGSDGSINITAADMTIVGGNDGGASTVIAEATCPTSGNYSFSWDFTTDDSSAFWDPAFYVNGVAVIQLTDDNLSAQSGSISVNCAAGDVIGFGVASQDGDFGAGVLTISDFTVGGTFLSYTNNGTGACEISGSVPAELSGSYDECGGELTLSWTYTDNCGRTITAQKAVTVEPAPEAEFAPIDDASIACEDLATYEPEFLSYSNGGTGACEIAGEVQGEAELFEGSCGTFDVDFTYTDDCGRTITAKQTITVVDETAPMMVGEIEGGESFLNACFEDRPEGPSIETVAAAFEDNCGNVNVTKEETVVENSDCQWAVFYVYTISDDCGNFANNVKISYFGSDQNAPQLTGDLPVGTEGLQCLADNPGVPEDVVAQITAAYTEDCGEVIVTPLEPVFTGNDCDWTVAYEFTVEDSCGNFADNVVIVNKGSDTMAPVYNGELDNSFTNTTLCYDSELGEPSAEDMREMFSDNCTSNEALIITKSVQAFGSDCQWLKVFIYTAEDACGNVSEPVKINYEGLDEEAPQPTGACDNEVMTISTEGGAVCPQDASISLQVGDEISAGDNSWTVAGLSVADMNGTLVPCYADNCAEVEELTYRVIEKGEVKSDCSTTLTVTFEVEDLCENVSEPFVCTFIIVDDTNPVITCPEGEDFGTVDEAPTAFADKAPYTDNCQPEGQTQDYTDNLTSVINEATDDVVGFVGDFAPENWTNTTPGTSSVTITASDLTMVGYDAFAADTEVLSLATCPASGQYSFDWDFSTTDNSAVWDPAFYVNGVAVIQLSDNDGGLVQSGSVSVNCVAGDVIGFRIIGDGLGTSTLNISNFTVGGLPTTEDFTLIRTFTADDGCGNTASCDVTYTWTEVLTPGNDDCDDATLIACGDAVMGSTEYASADDSLPFCGTSLTSAPGVWYVLEGTGDVLNVTADTFGSDYDTKLGIFSGSCDALTCVGGDDDDSGTLQSSVSFQSQIGVDYYIYVTGFGSATGEYMLSVACELPAGPTIVDCDGQGETVSVDNYGNNEFIEWAFESSTGDPLMVDLSGITENNFDFIFVYDGLNASAPLLGQFSGDLAGQSVTTTGQSVYIVFDSDGSVSGGSFTVDVLCAEDLGTIVDCGGPGETVSVDNYGNNEFIEWTFTSSTGDPLMADFSGVTENNFDFIFVYDGLDASAPLIATLDGNLAGQSVTTTGESIHIVFDSDGSVSGGSFTVDVACDDGNVDQPTIVDCGGPGETVDVVTQNSQFLEWKYTSSTGDALVVDFSGSTEDNFDFIFVYDGLDDSAPLLATLDGDLTGQSVTTTGDSVYIVFISDSSVSGFSFAVNVACELPARMAYDTKVDFTAYPVPFDHEVNIAYNFEFDTNVTIEVFDTKGLLVLTETNNRYVKGSEAVSTFDLSRYSNQLFYVKLTTSQGSVTKKIVSSGKK